MNKPKYASSPTIFYILWGLVTGSIFVVIPLYTTELNFNVYQISVFIAVPNFTLLFQPIWAIIISYFKQPKIVIQITTLISAVALLVLNQSSSFITILIAYTMYSIFINPMWTTIDNMIFGLADDGSLNYEQTRCFASYAYGLSYLLLVPLFTRVSTRSYFILAAIFYLLIVWTIHRIPASQKQAVDNHQFDLRAIKQSLFHNKFIRFIIFASFYGALLPLTIPYQTLLFEEMGVGIGYIGLATLLTTLLEGLLMNIGSKYYKRYGLHIALTTAVLLLATRALMFSLIDSPLVILLGCAIYGFSTAIYIPLLMSYVRKLVGAEHSNSGLLLIGFMTSLVAVIISIIATSYIDLYSIRAFYVINVVVLIIALVIIPFLKGSEN